MARAIGSCGRLVLRCCAAAGCRGRGRCCVRGCGGLGGGAMQDVVELGDRIAAFDADWHGEEEGGKAL